MYFTYHDSYSRYEYISRYIIIKTHDSYIIYFPYNLTVVYKISKLLHVLLDPDIQAKYTSYTYMVEGYYLGKYKGIAHC